MEGAKAVGKRLGGKGDEVGEIQGREQCLGEVSLSSVGVGVLGQEERAQGTPIGLQVTTTPEMTEAGDLQIRDCMVIDFNVGKNDQQGIGKFTNKEAKGSHEVLRSGSRVAL